MAPDENAIRAGRRPLADNVEGDIMTFSELDFARLGLAPEAIPKTTPVTQNESLPRNHFLPLQCLHYGESTPEHSTNQGLFSGPFPSFPDATRQNIAMSMIDPNLTYDPCWQTPSFPPQPSLAQNPPSQASPGTRNQASALQTSSQGTSPSGSYHYSPVAENQQPGLPRRRSRYFRSQHQPNLSQAIDIPGSAPIDIALDPMQRWRNSPPETEPASLSAIADAMRQTPLRTRSSTGSLTSQRIGNRAGSTVSFGSGTSCSSTSNASAISATFRSTSERSRNRVEKRTRPRVTGGKDKHKDRRKFPCTFCCDSFKSKYDWARHEKSLHLNLQGWRYSHDHDTCQNQGRPIFSRKDHLIQHLRLVHHVDTLPLIDSWKDEGPPVSSRCGFCNIQMQAWQERVDHLAKHFRKGATMDDWKGEHCFESSIAAKVTHAMPPYLIGSESRALIPFSANSHGTKDHLSQIQHASEQTRHTWNDGHMATPTSGSDLSPESTTQPRPLGTVNEDTSNMTFPEVLALHLGRYAQEQMRLGIIPTDSMFQDEARRIMFDSVDPWDQTIADNEDWLSLFRNRYVKDISGSQEDSI
ncbi:hypothetical protein HZS61_002684 [Fusarium oxysporum f. sp. conglutinans]|uniref:C2H2-type domain-containing protein n=1 Tax=Fusarium oxysporum f. sp. conglutinans TaxID=100902 RepID=A0A8H6GFC3_FUSOX|nr:hypothetical protein HZS61_002684 [Fusarium oxysporum f. sp. conglutinans]